MSYDEVNELNRNNNDQKRMRNAKNAFSTLLYYWPVLSMAAFSLILIIWGELI